MNLEAAMTNPTATLARFAADLDPQAVPAAVQGDTRRLLLDAVGSALVGWTSPEAPRMARAAATAMGPGASTVIGGDPLSPAGAALVNGYLITARSFCDVHRPTLCHVTPVVVPAALAAAERIGADGATLLAGLAAGMEVVLRVGVSLHYDEFRRRGWHTPGVAGPLGAAAAAGRIAGLDAATMTHALGLAGSQSGGTFASLGSPAIKFHQSRAAAAGLLAADLAAAGFTASPDILTAADGGMLGTFSDGGDPEALTTGLGDTWHLGEVSTRRWPAAAALQPLIAVLLETAIPAGGTGVVDIALPPDAFRMHEGVGWESPFQATLSPRWVAAVTLADHNCWLDQMAPDRLGDPVVAAAASKIAIHRDDTLPDGGIEVTWRDGAGTVRVTRIDNEPPADWESTADKARRAAVGTAFEARVDEIVAMVGGLEGLGDTRQLIRALA